MTTWMQWQDYLQALGLCGWQYRDDGVLAEHQSEQPVNADVKVNDQPGGGADSAAETEPMPAAEPEARQESMQTEAAEKDQAAARPAEDSRPQPAAKGSVVPALNWTQLEAYLAEQDHRGAQNPVFGTGARDADILIVGEAPGANEDNQGVPFVGRAGQLLDRMLFAIGCSRQRNVYITNICKFRPPDNRDPTPEEIATDWPILERQIELMQPRLVVAVGRIAAQTLLNKQESLGKMRGHWHTYPGRDLDVLVTYHPAFLLRSPLKKADAWQDLQLIARHLQAGASI